MIAARCEKTARPRCRGDVGFFIHATGFPAVAEMRENLAGVAYQQGTHRQQRGAQALIQPGPQPQPPVMPLHAACFTIGVAFLSA